MFSFIFVRDTLSIDTTLWIPFMFTVIVWYRTFMTESEPFFFSRSFVDGSLSNVPGSIVLTAGKLSIQTRSTLQNFGRCRTCLLKCFAHHSLAVLDALSALTLGCRNFSIIFSFACTSRSELVSSTVVARVERAPVGSRLRKRLNGDVCSVRCV